jgi:hypothetical protein
MSAITELQRNLLSLQAAILRMSAQNRRIITKMLSRALQRSRRFQATYLQHSCPEVWVRQLVRLPPFSRHKISRYPNSHRISMPLVRKSLLLFRIRHLSEHSKHPTALSYLFENVNRSHSDSVSRVRW